MAVQYRLYQNNKMSSGYQKWYARAVWMGTKTIDDLILAVQAAGVSRGRNGFRKDKGGEKLAETEELTNEA